MNSSIRRKSTFSNDFLINKNRSLIALKHRRNIQLILLLSYCIGYGAFWRFPYLVYSNGGGTFLIPFIICYFLMGLPLLYLEIVFGQLIKKGPFEIFSSTRLKFKGVGLTSLFGAFLYCFYNGVIICWNFYYFLISFQYPLPWNTHNTNNNIILNQEFFSNEVLKKSGGLETMGSINLHLIFSLFIVYLSLFLGIRYKILKSSKIQYYTFLILTAIILIFFLESISLEGYYEGLVFLFTPDLTKLLSYNIWIKAAQQVIFMMGLGLGGNVLISNEFAQDTEILTLSISIFIFLILSALICGVINFSYLGHISNLLKIPLIQLPYKGIDLAYMSYPCLISHIPLSNLISVFFYGCIYLVGIYNQVTLVEIINKYFYKSLLKEFCKRKTSYLFVTFLLFIFSIPFVYNGGIYLLEIFDNLVIPHVIFIILFFEVLIADKYIGYSNIQELSLTKTSQFIPSHIIICLKYICPSILFILNVVALESKLAENSSFTKFLPIFLEWSIIMIPILLIIIFIYKYKNESQNHLNGTDEILILKIDSDDEGDTLNL